MDSRSDICGFPYPGAKRKPPIVGQARGNAARGLYAYGTLLGSTSLGNDRAPVKSQKGKA